MSDMEAEIVAAYEELDARLCAIVGQGWEKYRPVRKEIARLKTALAPATEGGGRPIVSVKPMSLSDNRTDYFVSIKVADREVTPHVFREEYKAAYHVVLYDWLLNGSGEEPDIVKFGPDDWPARAPSPSVGTPEMPSARREAEA